jgi:predicted nucleotidyltransferase
MLSGGGSEARMLSLDYFWPREQDAIYIVRCGLATGEVVGRVSYVSSNTGDVIFAGRRYEKAGLGKRSHTSPFETVCDLPGDFCVAVPGSAVAGTLAPRDEGPRMRERVPDCVADLLTSVLGEADIPERDMAILGSRLFGDVTSSSSSDVDVAIYGRECVGRLSHIVQGLVRRGIVRKLPLDRDNSDRARMEFFGLSPSAMERVRTNQWSRKLLWSGVLVTFSFAPSKPYQVSLTQVGPEVELTGFIVKNAHAYYPPFSYRLDSDAGADIECCASFCWFFQHAFLEGEHVAARGTIGELNGRSCLWVWRAGHYLRPIP